MPPRLAGMLLVIVLGATPIAAAVCEMTCAPDPADAGMSCHLTAPDAVTSVGAPDPCRAAAAVAAMPGAPRSAPRASDALAATFATEPPPRPAGGHRTTAAPPSTSLPPGGYRLPLRL